MGKRMGWMAGVCLLVAMALPTAAAAKVTRHAKPARSASEAHKSASEAQVRQLMEVAGVNRMLSEMASQINTQLAGMMQGQLPCVPASYWNGFLTSEGFRQVTDAVVPVYQKHFSAADIEGLIRFYRSPLGKKMVAQMPAVMSESMQAGQAWGRDRAQAMLADLQKSGRIDAQGRCPATQPASPGLGGPAPAGSSAHH